MKQLGLVCLLGPSVVLAQPADPVCEAPSCVPAPDDAAVAPDPEPPADPAKVVEPAEAPPGALVVPTLTTAAPADASDEQPWELRLAGFIQSQYRMRENSPAPFDEDGFRLARVRLQARGEGKVGNLIVTSLFEGELAPTFVLFDAQLTVAYPLDDRGGVLQLDVGQMRVPLSRQQMLSDAKLSFVDKMQLSTLPPDRELGAYLTYVPQGLPQLRVMAGAFNGEGKNQIQNINESFLFAGRVELTPIGGPAPMSESAFDQRTWLSLGLSAGHNKLTPGLFFENRLYLGMDVSGGYRGLSGSFEYLEMRAAYQGAMKNLPGPPFKANGFGVQLAYLLPIVVPPGNSQLEIAGRIEEIDRNDTVPIAQIGDPNQSVRQYTGVISWYLRQHTLKAQLAFSHYKQLETLTSTLAPATYDNDQVTLQITYRVE